jgi:predicted glycoside hydrolase/deacetylase ChbG (UPF0249 family)
MVFMADSIRAAELASSRDIAVGLHLNFTVPFTNPPLNTRLCEHHLKVTNKFQSYRFYRYLYNPTLQDSIDYCFRSQYDEFVHLFGKNPSHIDGHHHIHLATNILFGGVIPAGLRVRKVRDLISQRNLFEVRLRNSVTKFMKKRFITTDLFYQIFPCDALVSEIFSKARFKNVELMVHPGEDGEFLYLNSDNYLRMVNIAPKGAYLDLNAANDNSKNHNGGE